MARNCQSQNLNPDRLALNHCTLELLMVNKTGRIGQARWKSPGKEAIKAE